MAQGPALQECHSDLVLRVRPPGIEWKSGRQPKMGKTLPKKIKWPTARNQEKNGPEMVKKGFWDHFSICSPFLGLRCVGAR